MNNFKMPNMFFPFGMPQMPFNFDMSKMPFPFCMNQGQSQDEGMCNPFGFDMSKMPFPFPFGMPQMPFNFDMSKMQFPFFVNPMSFMNQMPFNFDMTKMPFPFGMFCGGNKEGEGDENAEAQCGFDLSKLPIKLDLSNLKALLKMFGIPGFGGDEDGEKASFFENPFKKFPKEMVQMLMSLELSPEGTKMLQAFLDRIFDLYSQEAE